MTVANETGEIALSMRDLRGVAGYAAEGAQETLEIFERAHPADSRRRMRALHDQPARQKLRMVERLPHRPHAPARDAGGLQRR